MAAIPFMPLYVADYLSDAAHLSTLEHGAYLLLIMTYWQRGEPLPADDKKLARICRIGPREWARIKPSISEFFQVDCSGWSHSRIERELANVRSKSLNKRKGGLARAEQMHSKRTAPAQQSDTEADTEELPPSPRKRGSSGKTIIAEDWIAPSVAELPAKARACAEHWTEASYETHAEAFHGYWRSRRTQYADWRATWANRVIALHSQVMRDQKYGNAPPDAPKAATDPNAGKSLARYQAGEISFEEFDRSRRESEPRRSATGPPRPIGQLLPRLATG